MLQEQSYRRAHGEGHIYGNFRLRLWKDVKRIGEVENGIQLHTCVADRYHVQSTVCSSRDSQGRQPQRARPQTFTSNKYVARVKLLFWLISGEPHYTSRRRLVEGPVPTYLHCVKSEFFSRQQHTVRLLRPFKGEDTIR